MNDVHEHMYGRSMNNVQGKILNNVQKIELE